jgi:UTP--glucose-1-phosphate uridylyltransferase
MVPRPRGDEPALIESMMAIYERHQANVVTVVRVAKEDIPSYGVIDPEKTSDGLLRVLNMVEKPPAEEARSDLGSRGRYLFTPAIFDALDRTTSGYGGEIQLTDAINLLAQEQSVYAYVHEGPMFDVGKKLDYLKATIELGLRRKDLGEQLKAYVLEVAARIG